MSSLIPTFSHFELELVKPSFDSDLATYVVGLEQLRHAPVTSSTPPQIFDQIKRLFHIAESIGSARIEGNRTTMTDYVQTKLEGDPVAQIVESMREIENIEEALIYLESHLRPGEPITHKLVRELHAIVVQKLKKEGDANPGSYRKSNVTISGSAHRPPEHTAVQNYMEALLAFINDSTQRKYELIKVAQAHHRFAWIHPFANGNGRVVRLLTYAMLIHYGFDIASKGRILNPTAIFCVNRDQYYNMLAAADQGDDIGLISWCEYVLQGLQIELTNINKLANYEYLKQNIILPSFQRAMHQGVIDDIQYKILVSGIKHSEIKRDALLKEMPTLNAHQMTYQLTKLQEQKIISPVREGARIYIPNLSISPITRWIIQALQEKGFLDRNA